MAEEKLLFKELLNKEQLGDKCRMYSEVTVKPGGEVGYHIHQNDAEAYYFLKGTGIYSDNGKEVVCKAGDLFYCKDGDGHGLVNNGTDDIVFIALIINS